MQLDAFHAPLEVHVHSLSALVLSQLQPRLLSRVLCFFLAFLFLRALHGSMQIGLYLV